jgi:hypothetical protein
MRLYTDCTSAWNSYIYKKYSIQANSKSIFYILNLPKQYDAFLICTIFPKKFLFP